jgi:hypothetical protein
VTNARRKLTQAEEVLLLSAVGNRCPLCDSSLFYVKGSRTFRHFEIAHIYPLNPLTSERSLLAEEAKLNADPNHTDNLIPLCPSCHGKFDKPRTVDEYLKLFEVKKASLSETDRRALARRYEILDDIRVVVASLESPDFVGDAGNLVLDAKTLDQKLKDTMPATVRRKIRFCVSEYFYFVRQALQRMDTDSPGSSSLVLSQVRTFYLEQKRLGWTQHEIFTTVVCWIEARTKPKTVETAEILASFFIQNCEVFE